MTLEEFKNELESAIKINTERLEEEKILGNSTNTAYYKGRVSSFLDTLRIIESVDKDLIQSSETLIEVTFQFYSILLEELRVRKRTFKSLEEYTAWVRHVTVKESDIQIINVSYVDKELIEC